MVGQIQEIKSKYGQSAESIIANGLGLIKKGKKYKCPNSFAHKHGDKDPSMSWDSKALQFYCFGCGMKIDIYGYYREHLNYTHDEVARELLGTNNYKDTLMQKARDNFEAESRKVINITKECINYIKTRGITEETIKEFNLKTYRGFIAFPYYRYETIVGYKIRKPVKNPGKPKMMNIEGSKPYLFNVQNVDLNNPELIICEGEFDCMVISQCGFKNVVSVGAGANSLCSILNQAKDFLNNFKSLIIVSDNDEYGEKMDRKMVEVFGSKVKIIDKSLYELKDINEEYYKHGQQKVVKIIESATKMLSLNKSDIETIKRLIESEKQRIKTDANLDHLNKLLEKLNF